MEVIVKIRRLKWFRLVLLIDDGTLPNKSLYYIGRRILYKAKARKLKKEPEMIQLNKI